MTGAEARQAETDEAALLRALFAHSHDGMLVVGADGRVICANDASQRLLGPSPMGASLADARGIVGPDVVAAVFNGEVGRLMGQVGPLEFSAVLLRPAIGLSGGCLVRLAPAPPDRANTTGPALGPEAAGLVHDLNNMLAVILGAAGDGAGNADWAAIIRAAERGRTMLRAVLTSGTTQRPGRTPPLELDDAIAASRSMLAHLCGDRVAVRLEPGAPGLRVALSREVLERILLNLVANARDASPGGGVVTVRTRRGGSMSGERGIVEVHDDGPGIPREVLARMGERLFTTKAPGLGVGLGLATVRDLVGEIGGHLSIDSRVGEGTSIAIHIPTCGRTDPLLAATGDTVLLVDDEDLLRGLVARALTQAGWRVLQAGSAEAALDAMNPPPVDLAALVTDRALPGMTGTDLVARVRALPGCENLPVILASGWPGGDPEAGRAADSPTAMLAKPFDLRDLTALLARMTASARAARLAARQKMG